MVAQVSNAQTQTGRYVDDFVVPIECEGVQSDWISVTGTVQWVIHFNHGELIWWKFTIHFEGENESGEHFKGVSQEKQSFDPEEGPYTMMLHVKGDMGTHYKLFLTVDWNVLPYPYFEYTVDKGWCH
jgi:hypothetical protein